MEINSILQGNMDVLRISSYSLNVNNIKKIPIVFHNGSNYDHQLSKKT